MSSPVFPVAPTVEAALHAPLGAAGREGEAARLAGGDVRLTTEPVGPAFATRDAAAEAYAARLDQPWCELRPVIPDARAAAPVRALRTGPRRWPERPASPPAQWRLQVTFWRCGAAEEGAPLAAARQARRDAGAAALDARALRRLAAQPLQALRAQQPLDIGLFEVRAPEAPHLILPDE